jgi:enolase
MNKRIKKKHKPYFNLGLLGSSFAKDVKLENDLGHKIDHRIHRSLINRRFREYRKEPKNTEMIDFTKDLLEKLWLASVEQSFHPMDYYENKSMEESINEQKNQKEEI